MSSSKKIGLIACTGVVAGNMMGSGIALLPANLASLGSIAIFGWIISLVGAMSLAYVYARLATKNPQQGGPIAYAGEVGPAFGFQTGVLYYHANWIGNLAIGITAVSYLSTFFPLLNSPVPAGIACIAIVWIFTFVNMLGGTWVSRLTTIGLVLVLIPVVGTAIAGWAWFDPAVYHANWNTSGGTDTHAVVKSILLCLWAFVGVESAAVSTGMVKNPQRTVPLATMMGTCLAGIVYIAATQVIAGMFPASEMAASGAPFAVSASAMVGHWAGPVVSAFTAFACLTSLGSWMMLVGQAGVRAANDGNFPKVYGEMDKNGIPKKGLLLASVKMTVLMVLITILNASGGKASDLFGMLTGIAVLLTMLPYFYSCVDLIRFEGANVKNIMSLVAAVLGCCFCFIALMGAGNMELSGTFIVSLIILMFYARKMNTRKAQNTENNSNAAA
ncbi:MULTISPECIES: cadaverine/lysine antiporter [Edwardsiella]|uniref:Cadaverine/lysine antiporter n=2 Tax=Edwardsiella anguillarum TaxID=1821960 RepID=A0A076LM66_9GAMM|nr:MULTISPECIES: cadaverine/lysine antiporter [Edwardsiella]AKM48693.1 lysine/cadaverine antiporter [Edwardsiella sp. EA181011]GAJ66753.1 arginine/agmatine antiporter [Edwardsiella piscicida]AIJ08956.1 Lysine/cadaverine antiporter membrane protein CadB [Edwardsiella anguillarum ET080813]AKR76935.1 cadaverine/lysine antiporter [Edwardsiella sp. LADL05-105]KAB0592285.1 cadaverine/lysine antiporter [Edwardsiella anguillarum]